jgi:hypothetical protein
MFFDINNLSQETSALRKALKHHTGPASELSHVECQQILARVAGFSNLHACKAHLSQPRFRDRHAPYLTGDIHELVDLVQRRAVQDELKEFGDPSERSWQTIYLESTQRMKSQLSSIQQGKLRVHPKLKLALERAESETLQQLRRSEMLNEIAFQEVLWKANSGQGSSSEYDEAYANWRLASLSRYLRYTDTREPHQLFETLSKRFDFYRVVAGILLLGLTNWPNMNTGRSSPNDNSELRQVGKALALQLMNGTRLNEKCFMALYRVRAPENLEVLEHKWHDQFPEFRMWHIWCELKPVFASDADAFWARRR